MGPLRIEPFMWRKVPTDRVYYFLYAKAAELDVAFQTQVGHTGPLFPSETGRPIYIDDVALDFPELRIVCGHIGWPWTEEMIAVAWKHKNVWIDDYRLLQWERVLREVDSPEIRQRFARQRGEGVQAAGLTPPTTTNADLGLISPEPAAPGCPAPLPCLRRPAARDRGC